MNNSINFLCDYFTAYHVEGAAPDERQDVDLSGSLSSSDELAHFAAQEPGVFVQLAEILVEDPEVERRRQQAPAAVPFRAWQTVK